MNPTDNIRVFVREARTCRKWARCCLTAQCRANYMGKAWAFMFAARSLKGFAAQWARQEMKRAA